MKITTINVTVLLSFFFGAVLFPSIVLASETIENVIYPNSRSQTITLNATTTIKSVSYKIAVDPWDHGYSAYNQITVWSIPTASTTITGSPVSNNGFSPPIYSETCDYSGNFSSEISTTVASSTVFVYGSPITLSPGAYRFGFLSWGRNSTSTCNNDFGKNITFAYDTSNIITSGERQTYDANSNASVISGGATDLIFRINEVQDQSISPYFLSPLQQNVDDGVALPEGVVTREQNVTFKTTLVSIRNNKIKLQVELKNADEPFSEANLIESEYVVSGNMVSVTTSIPLLAGRYHWRARGVDDLGSTGDWEEFGVDGNPDFIVVYPGIPFVYGVHVYDVTATSFSNTICNAFYPYSNGVHTFYSDKVSSGNILGGGAYTGGSGRSLASSVCDDNTNSAWRSWLSYQSQHGEGVYLFFYNQSLYTGGSGFSVGGCISSQYGPLTNIDACSNESDYYIVGTLTSGVWSFGTPTIDLINQLKSDAVTSIAEGATTTESTLVFSGVVSSSDNFQTKLQVEIKSATSTFDGTDFVESGFVTSGSIATTTSNMLTAGSYHWRARAMDDKGNASDWQEFGTVGNTDVAVENRCTQNCYSNVMFLPGIMGSRLFENGSDCGVFTNEKERWVSTWDCDHARLELNQDGKSKNPVYTKEGAEGVIDDTYTVNIYQSFMDDLKKWKDTEKIINGYSLVAYDWRLSLEDILQNGATSTGKLSYSTPQGFTEGYIYREIKRLADSSKTKKVTIVAHSNGGLVTKALIQKLKETNDPLYDRIDNVVFVAVPQSGTPEAVVRLLHGKKLGLGFVMEAKRLRALSQNMPVAYNLLPSSTYFSGQGLNVNTAVITFGPGSATRSFVDTYGRSISNEVDLERFLKGEDGRVSPLYNNLDNPSVATSSLLASAKVVHNGIDDSWNYSTSTSVYQVAGWGEDTLATIHYRSIPDCVKVAPRIVNGNVYYQCVRWGTRLTFDPKEVIDGDGTVVTPSALAMSTSTERVKRYWVDLKEYDRLRYGNIERNHADIFEINELQTFIQNIITGADLQQSPFILTSAPKAKTGNERLRFVLHSPLDLSISDNLGNVVNSSTSTIPGSRWKQFGSVQVITVPKDTPITLNLDGYASGSFTLDMQEIDGNNDIVASSTIEAIPSATSTKATMSFTAGTLQSATPLVVDYDGDSTADFTIDSEVGKTTGLDLVPPEVGISFSTSTQKLRFVGVDESLTTIITIATSTLVVDQSGNTLQITHSKNSREKKELKFEIKALRYNGELATSTPNATLQLEWSVDKNGIIKELEQKAEIEDLKIEAHYNAKKNVTEVITTMNHGKNGHNREDEHKNRKNKVSNEIISGVVILEIVTDNGDVIVKY